MAKSRLLGSDFVGGEMTGYRTETPGGWIPLLKETQQLSKSNSYITNHKGENLLVSPKQSHRNAPMTEVMLQERIRNEAPYTLTRFPFFSKHCCSKALSTLTRFQKYAFSLSSKTHRSICVHTKVFVRFRLLQRTVVLTVVSLYNN